MKVFSGQNLKKTPANPIQNPVLTYFSLSLMALSLFVLLTACGDRKATTVNPTGAATVPATAAVNTSLAASTAAIATGSQTTQPTFSNNRPVPTPQISSGPDETFSGKVAHQPTITFSPEIVEIGQSVEIHGKGYPANTRLNIRVAVSDLKADGLYASVLTGETGAFTTSFKLESSFKNNLLTPGKVEITVTTTDNRIGASAPLALQPASNATQDETCKNLVLEFFASLKRNPSLAQVYLSADLRNRIATGKTSLTRLLGSENAPLRVEVARVNDAADSYQATMFFSAGEQKSVVLDLSTDVSGALKISAIHAK